MKPINRIPRKLKKACKNIEIDRPRVFDVDVFQKDGTLTFSTDWEARFTPITRPTKYIRKAISLSFLIEKQCNEKLLTDAINRAAKIELIPTLPIYKQEPSAE
jgi:hypothetical protein